MDPIISENQLEVSAHAHSSMFCILYFFEKSMIIELFLDI